MNCYFCNKQLDKRIKTKEHIPAKALFKGFQEKLTHNIITVPACRKCNDFFSKVTDEEFRNQMAAVSNKGENEGLIPYAIRGMNLRLNEYLKRIKDINGQKVLEMDFHKTKLFHLKNFKGLIKKHYGFSMTEDNWDYLISIDEEPKPSVQNILKYLTENFEYQISGHQKIFKYIIVKIDRNQLPFEGYPFNESYACIMINNNVHAGLVMGIDRVELETERGKFKR